MNNLDDFKKFIIAHTQPKNTALVPEITLYQASKITPIWQASEKWLQENNIEPPFWAFVWPGGQSLARYILDNPEFVQKKRVLDFAAGCGIAAIACALCQAAYIEVADIDPMAQAACTINAALNQVILDCNTQNVVGASNRWDIILCGDVCYEAPMTRHIWPWLKHCAEQGAEVIIADPGRAYLPKKELEAIRQYDVPTTLELEDCTQRQTTLYRLSIDTHPK